MQRGILDKASATRLGLQVSWCQNAPRKTAEQKSPQVLVDLRM